jgi:hypothetical protein
MNEAILINEWDSDAFHKQVLEFQARGYTARPESYRITPVMDPETGRIVHQYSVEMDMIDSDQAGP